MLRTKYEKSNEGGVAAGSGALDSPYLYDDWFSFVFVETQFFLDGEEINNKHPGVKCAFYLPCIYIYSHLLSVYKVTLYC